MTIESTGSRAFSNVTTSIQPCWDLSLFVISKLDLLRILGRFRKSRLLKQACHIQICPEFQIYSHYCPSNNGTGSSVLGFLKPSTITIGWQLSFLFYRSHVETRSIVNIMSGECEARLLKLQQYVPFLHRTKEYYISSPEEVAKIAQLITIISSAGEQ